MKKIFIFIAVCSVLISCAVTPTSFGKEKNIGHGYAISHVVNGKIKYGHVQIEYKDYDYIYRRELEKLNNRMASDSEKNKMMSNIPAGGYIVINIERLTIDTANTRWFEFVVTSGGSEVYRKKGKSNIANTPISNGMWGNTAIVPLNSKVSSEITLYVIDTILGGRDEFKIGVPTNIQKNS